MRSSYFFSFVYVSNCAKNLANLNT